MAANRARTPAVMLGVGAVFDVLAGAKPHAPLLIRRAGLRVALSVGAGAAKAPLEIRAPQSAVCVEKCRRESGQEASRS